MRFSRLATIAVVLLVLAAAILGFACAGEQGEQGPRGVPGPNMIVAAGSIKADGTVAEGYNVEDCTWTASNYIVDIEGVDLNSVDQVVIATPWGASVNDRTRTLTTGTDDEGRLLVWAWDSRSGLTGQCPFSFMVLDTTP